MITLEQVIEKINAKFTVEENGKTVSRLHLSDRTVSESVTNMLKFATEETELDAFVDNVFPVIDSANNNLIKDNADFKRDLESKALKTPKKPETPPVDPPVEKPGVTSEDVKQMVADALAEKVTPLQQNLDKIETEKALSARRDDVDVKIKELKLTKSWGVDFKSSLKIAELELGPKATADEVFDAAKTAFNANLASKGETYKPQETKGGIGGAKFDSKAEKERLIANGQLPPEEKKD